MDFAIALSISVGLICFALGMIAGFISYDKCKPIGTPMRTDELRKD